MKTWMIFAVGVAVLIATVFLPTYQAFILPGCAVALIGCVVTGFVIKPRRDVFYVRTSLPRFDIDGDLWQEHEQLAVRLEITRLWMLFVPAFSGAAFFIVMAAQASGWAVDLFGLEINTVVLYGLRFFEVFVVWVLSAWLRERWVLRDAQACSVRNLRLDSGYVTYSFRLSDGEYYGGEAVAFQYRPLELVSLVLYNVANPDLNALVMSCVFHRLKIIGRGVTDLDGETVANVRAHPVQSEI